MIIESSTRFLLPSATQYAPIEEIADGFHKNLGSFWALKGPPSFTFYMDAFQSASNFAMI